MTHAGMQQDDEDNNMGLRCLISAASLSHSGSSVPESICSDTAGERHNKWTGLGQLQWQSEADEEESRSSVAKMGNIIWIAFFYTYYIIDI